MNGLTRGNGGNLRFSKTGTPPAVLLASPMTGQPKRQGSRNKTMTYTASNFRTAFVAVAFTIVASAIFMAGAVGPAITA
jgi:hypothetical protein